ncbi:nicotinate-nucleotide--dimethylbenzimidazole phosphoribosyltransferase [Reinekea thalattae]|uniref:Nicotinate-nucleotide--dimethylbenzimidazole phosphoribosyltransferase n=1 Tax=Reinekea thalattae TaxID=2593301 RepID=A0A5C8Z3I7_9GAMM|nr:nicotinate-nucleotide--dimethylbenzimidazole phosphoribosyltransferase [Reinekea thalattae]TXR52107.1 nicotinate-nucleotide--dimethylbenzimidazole phosphoribosyltransferase [Reinekea thalattae]
MNQPELKQQLQHKIDNLTKPPGSLGMIEQLAAQIGMIQNTTEPKVDKPQAFVFGADHGVCAEGVTAFPQIVTEQMLANFAAGGAAMSVFCKTNAIPLKIINMGIVNEQARWENVQHSAIAPGTKNFRHEAAMTEQQCLDAIAVGENEAKQAVANGANLLIVGEMGIGNSSSSSALLSALHGLSATATVGAGAGSTTGQQSLKIEAIDQALARCKGKTPLAILAEVGGFEIAAMAGVMLQARSLNVPVMIDGFIAGAAALFAEAHQPGSKDYWIFSHSSAEQAHVKMLAILEATPLLQLNLRLGEGSGSALAYPLVKCAAAMINDMASFESAGVAPNDA